MTENKSANLEVSTYLLTQGLLGVSVAMSNTNITDAKAPSWEH